MVASACVGKGMQLQPHHMQLLQQRMLHLGSHHSHTRHCCTAAATSRRIIQQPNNQLLAATSRRDNGAQGFQKTIFVAPSALEPCLWHRRETRKRRPLRPLKHQITRHASPTPGLLEHCACLCAAVRCGKMRANLSNRRRGSSRPSCVSSPC